MIDNIIRIYAVLVFANAAVFVACFEVSLWASSPFVKGRADLWALRAVLTLGHLLGAGLVVVFCGWLYWHWDKL